MKVLSDKITGSVTVEYCSTHTGHSVDLAHLPISSEVRHSIASKLYDGVSVDTILRMSEIAYLMAKLVENSCFHVKMH